MQLYHNFKNLVRKHDLVAKNDTIVLGVSGGADSMVLLHLFSELSEVLSLRVVIAHVNYQTRGVDSKQDEELVRKTSRTLGLPFKVLRVDGRKHSKNFEAWARKVRYDFFEKVRKATHAQHIAVAHTMNDQAETLLLHIAKGTGIGGLAAMRMREGKIIRPLLPFQKSQLVAYLQKRGVPFREDVTNLDTKYTRNNIRHNILPLLARELNPNIIETLAHESEIFQGMEDYLELKAGVFLHRHVDFRKNSFLQLPFVAEPIIIQYTIIQQLMKRLGEPTPPSFAHFQEIAHILNQNIGNKSKELTKHLKIRLNRGVITIVKAKN